MPHKHPRVRRVYLKKFLKQLLYQAALPTKELEGGQPAEIQQLVRNYCRNVMEYSLRQFYRDFVGKEFTANHDELNICEYIHFPSWVKFVDMKPVVKPCLDRLLDLLYEDAGRDHIILLSKS